MKKQHIKKQLRIKAALILAAVLVFGTIGCGQSGEAAGEPVREEASAEQKLPEGNEASAGQQLPEGNEDSAQAQEKAPGAPGGKGADAAGAYWFSGKSADEILARMTLEQKVWQMIQPAIYMTDLSGMKSYDFGSILSKDDGTYLSSSEWKDLVLEYQKAALESEAGIPFIYGQDDVHGVNYCKGAVIYPHNIGLGAANDADLMYEIGAATADEAKMTGMLWNFAPCVAVSTDPRWGRTYESYSSDPEIVGELGSAYVKGLKDGGIAACGKHFFADGSEEWGTGENGYLIDRGDASLTEEETDALLDVYRKLIDAGVPTIMLSHGSVGGVKMHENGKYISILRGELGFDGMIVSDWESIHNISGSSFSEQMANAINAGVDMLMEPNMYRETYDAVMQAVNSGTISEERINDAVRHILQFKIETGVMDDPFQEAVTTKQSACGSDEYRALAERAVEESLVLLKDEGAALPLRSGSRVYVTGPALDNMNAQCGGWTESWNGATRPIEGATTILEGLRQTAKEQNITLITDPSQAQSAEVTLVFVGERPYAEWNGDSADISLTGALALPENSSAIQEAENLRREHGIPTVGCIVAGRQVIISDCLDQWDAAVMCYLPGSDGKGLANVLMGQAEFTGKLPMPWYASVEQIGTEQCLFPAGYGLSGEAGAGGESDAGGENESAGESGAGGESENMAESGAAGGNEQADENKETAKEEAEQDAAEPEQENQETEGLTETFQGHTYTLIEEGMGWSAAEKYCIEHGGHLASAGTEEEQAFLEKLAEKSSRPNIWIGGSLNREGVWHWSDGTEFSYTNWDDGQPDNYGGKEKCIRFTNKDVQYSEWTAHKGKWNDTAIQGDKDAKLRDFAFIMESAE